MRRFIVGVLAPVIVLAGVIGACDTAPNDLNVGSCLAQLPGTDQSVTSVSTAGCDKEHAAEVYAVFDWSGSEGNDNFPGDSAISDKAQTGCVDGFQPYVGSTVDQSSLDVYWLTPTSDSWGKGDRKFICIAAPKDSSKLTGSIKGSNK